MDAQKSFVIYTALFIVLIALAFWVVKPFLLSIFGGAIIAYIFYPVYKWFLKRVKSKGWSAFIVTLLIILIFTVPLFFLVEAFAKDAYFSYILVKQRISTTIFTGEPCSQQGFGCSIINWVRGFVSDSQAKFYVNDALNRATQLAINKAQEIITKIPSFLVQTLVVMFVVYYSLKDGELLIKNIAKVIPIKKMHYSIIINRLKEMTSSTIYGIMVVAGIQGGLAGIGYFIFGIKSPVLLGVLTALAALLPVIGTALVWGPTVIIYFFNAAATNNSTGIALSLGLLAYCIFPVSTIDNLIRPKIISKRAKIHPIMVLLGILGGVAAFGFVGILIGPIILTLFLTFVDIYEQERTDHAAES